MIFIVKIVMSMVKAFYLLFMYLLIANKYKLLTIQ